MNLSPKIRVAVLRGGQAGGYDISLKTGAHILSLLREMNDKYEPTDIFISKDGEWHYGGIVHEPYEALRHVDVVFNALHGAYGEDGQVQRLLESLQIPFTGSGAVASALVMDKELTKRLYRRHSLLTPCHELINEEDCNEDRLITIFRTYLHPMIIKPARRFNNRSLNLSGSPDARLAATFQELKQVVKETFSHSPEVLVEEFIKGDEVSCVVIEEAKGERIYALIPTGKSEFRLKVDEHKQIEEIAKRAHEMFGLRHYSGSNFIITPRKKIYILETNALPALHEDSLAHRSLQATGWRARDFVDHVLKLAR